LLLTNHKRLNVKNYLSFVFAIVNYRGYRYQKGQLAKVKEKQPVKELK